MSVATKEQMLKDFDEDVRKLRDCLAEGTDDPKDLGYSLVAVGPNRTGALFNSNNMMLLIGAMTIELNRQAGAFQMRSMLDKAQDAVLLREAAKNPT